MHAASDRQSSYLQRASLRSRAVSGLLAAALTFLIILMLMTVSALGPMPRENKPLVVTFNLKPPPPPEHARSVKKVENSSHSAAPHQAAKVPPLNMVVLTRKDFAAADIATLPSHASNGANGTDKGAETGNTDGPGGEAMYDVAWYREPTRAELAPYMPATGPEVGSALLACRMIEHYHVEDCRELGETPPGSGLSRALRQASWQFLVRPPRVGGKSILGGWVRIRFEFTASGKAED
jgi:hypothetical protein